MDGMAIALLEAVHQMSVDIGTPGRAASSRPTRSFGKRRVTPPKNNAFAKASEASAKWPMWLFM